jgi:hypothetical protein
MDQVLQIGIFSALICFGMSFLYRWIGVLLGIWPLAWLTLYLMGPADEKVAAISPYLSVFLIVFGIVAGFVMHHRVTKKAAGEKQE